MAEQDPRVPDPLPPARPGERLPFTGPHRCPQCGAVRELAFGVDLPGSWKIMCKECFGQHRADTWEPVPYEIPCDLCGEKTASDHPRPAGVRALCSYCANRSEVG